MLIVWQLKEKADLGDRFEDIEILIIAEMLLDLILVAFGLQEREIKADAVIGDERFATRKTCQKGTDDLGFLCGIRGKKLIDDHEVALFAGATDQIDHGVGRRKARRLDIEKDGFLVKEQIGEPILLDIQFLFMFNLHKFYPSACVIWVKYTIKNRICHC